MIKGEKIILSYLIVCLIRTQCMIETILPASVGALLVDF